jgi:hypothetical protein
MESPLRSSSVSSPMLCSCTVRMYSLRTSFTLPLDEWGEGGRVGGGGQREGEWGTIGIQRVYVRINMYSGEGLAHHKPLVLMRSVKSFARSACFFTLL